MSVPRSIVVRLAVMTDDLVKRVAAAVLAELGPLVERHLRQAMAREFGLATPPGPPLPRGTGFAPRVVRAAQGAAKLPRPGAPREESVPAEAGREAPTDALSIEAIVTALADGPKEGLRSEVLRERLGLPDTARRRLARMLREAVASKAIARKGTKRGATFSLARGK